MNTETVSSVQSSSVNAPASTPTSEARELLAYCQGIASLANRIGPDALLALASEVGRMARLDKKTRPDFAGWVAMVSAISLGKLTAQNILAAARHANNQADGEVFATKGASAGGNTVLSAKLKHPAAVALRMD